jgi:hypothetical protein
LLHITRDAHNQAANIEFGKKMKRDMGVAIRVNELLGENYGISLFGIVA